ncbi:MAG: response regulator, partial [Thiogranum sp.]
MASDRENSTILLVDDHPLMRKGLRALLEGEPGLEVAGEAGDGEEAIEQVRTLSPDIVVMDVSMPRLNGIEATRRLLEEAPRTRVLALSIHSEKRFVDEMLRAGAAGYLLKDSAPEELVRAVRALLRGESYVSAPLIGTLISSLRQTPSEQTPAPSPGLSPDGTRAPDPPPAGTGEATTQAPAISAPQVLRTKLYPPTFPADMVPRTDLLERLEAGKTRPLALVSAPAGYGKSLLVGSWLESCGWASAWLSLDEGDGDLRQFLSGLVDAVQTRFPAACASSRRLTEAHELPSVKTLSTALSNDLDALPEPLVLALDDYHRIDGGSPVNELLQRLLALPPIPLHLVIATRRDPPLPLARLRAMGQITEIRMSDLRFGPSETRALLAQSAGFSPGDRALANLDRELEGWVVGLRLVSLAVRESEDPDGFLVGLHGGVQQTEEYLVQEVIGRQPPRLRDWLLRSAILDRFCPSLCDAVCAGGDNRETGEESTGDKAARGEGAAFGTDGAFDGARFTQALKAGNLFTIALDAQERWFRFH